MTSKRSSPRKHGQIVQIDEARSLRGRRQKKEAESVSIDVARREADERFDVAAKSRGGELPNSLDLSRLALAFRSHGEIEASAIVRTLDLLLHGPEFLRDRKKLLTQLAAAGKALLRAGLGLRNAKGRPRSEIEIIYEALCEQATPRIGKDPLDVVATKALFSIRVSFGYRATLQDVRKSLRSPNPDHESVIRACFRACKVPGNANLGKLKVVRRAREIRERRKK